MAQIIIGTGIAPATPIAGQVTVYAKAADKKLYYKDEAGIETGPLGTGTVAAVSIVSAGGFTGSVANPTTSPAITLATSITGVLKGVSGALAVATNADLPVMSATVGGAVPTPPNDATKFLNGQGAFTVPGVTTGSVTQASLAANVVGTGPAFSAYNSTTTAIANSGWTHVDFQTKEYDTNTYYNATTGVFTPLIAGYYLVVAVIQFAATCPTCGVAVYKNGSSAKIVYAVGVGGVSASGLSVIYMNGSTDYLEVKALQNSAVSVNTATGLANTYFQGFLARAA